MRFQPVLLVACLITALVTPGASAWTCVNEDYPGECVGFNEDPGDPGGCMEFCINIIDRGDHRDICVKTAHDTPWECVTTLITPPE